MEADATIYKLLIGLSMGLRALCIFIRAWLSGLFRETGDIKYRICRREIEEDVEQKQENAC